MTDYRHPAEDNMTFASLVGVACCRAANQAQKTAYTFLADGANQGRHLTYAGLDRRARAIAAFLQDAGMPGSWPFPATRPSTAR